MRQKLCSTQARVGIESAHLRSKTINAPVSPMWRSSQRQANQEPRPTVLRAAGDCAPSLLPVERSLVLGRARLRRPIGVVIRWPTFTVRSKPNVGGMEMPINLPGVSSG